MDVESDAEGKTTSVEVRKLFGGALSIKIPTSFEDISKIREVPDHQEVFADRDSNMSLIIELLDYEDSISDDKAADHFYKDLANFNEATNISVCHNEIIRDINFIPNIPSQHIRSILIGYQTVKKFNKTSSSTTTTTPETKSFSPSKPISSTTTTSLTGGDNVQIIMLLIRLAIVGTDVLITLNNPTDEKQLVYPPKCLVYAKPADEFVSSINYTGIDIMKCIAHSFQIQDWSLFA